jgi:2',3'-cyclic-nucleotide 2'-phosphodiesterase (5'-nucleotidase family)
MHYLGPRHRLLTMALTVLLVGVFAHATVAQSPAQSQTIEPCPASSPTPAIVAASVPAKVNSKVSQTAVDASIPDDPVLQKIVSAYSPKVRELSAVIGTLEGELKKSGIGGASLGNFVTDAMMFEARAKGHPVVVAITNSGGLRKNTIAPGRLRASDIFELLPFENALVEVELTGTQLLKLLENLTRGRDAQAGARVQFRWNEQDRPEFISAKLVGLNATGERDIDPSATYSIVTIDYLLKLGSGNYALLQEAKRTTPLNITIRDAVMDYVKAEAKAGRSIHATLDNRFVQVGPGPKRSESTPDD